MASRIAIRAGGEEEETGVRERINNQQLLPHICQDPERAETLCLKMLLLLGGVLLPSSGFGALCMMLSKSRLQGLQQKAERPQKQKVRFNVVLKPVENSPGEPQWFGGALSVTFNRILTG